MTLDYYNYNRMEDHLSFSIILLKPHTQRKKLLESCLGFGTHLYRARRSLVHCLVSVLSQVGGLGYKIRPILSNKSKRSLESRVYTPISYTEQRRKFVRGSMVRTSVNKPKHEGKSLKTTLLKFLLLFLKQKRTWCVL